MDEVKMINEAILNQAFTLPLNENLVDSELVNGSTRYFYIDKNGVKRHAFKRLEQWYYMPLNDENGGWVQTIDWDTFTEYQSKYGSDFKPLGALPKEELQL